MCLTVLLGGVIFFFGRYFVMLFTDDESVLAVAESVMGFLSIFVVLDGNNAVCSGILRGTGRQNVGAVTNVISYYLFGLPAAWLLCFNAEWGVRGLMMGLSAGTLCQVLSLSTMIFCFQDYIFTADIVAKGQGRGAGGKECNDGGGAGRGKGGEQAMVPRGGSAEDSSAWVEVGGMKNGSAPGLGGGGSGQKFVIIEEIGDGDDDWIDA